ncbi:TPA: hypothetical protein ACGU7J_003421 [Vibrio vulnificus]
MKCPVWLVQINCSINHTLNQSATSEELYMLLSLMKRNYFRPNLQQVIAAFVERQTIKNFLEELGINALYNMSFHGGD